MTAHLELREADRLRRAENRWLEQARERLRRPPAPPRPAASAIPRSATPPSATSRTKETDR